jgi:hypothetical protein
MLKPPHEPGVCSTPLDPASAHLAADWGGMAFMHHLPCHSHAIGAHSVREHRL